VLDNKCHEDFIKCLDRVARTGKKGFSKKVGKAGCSNEAARTGASGSGCGVQAGG
jgi:hypothetical protein